MQITLILLSSYVLGSIPFSYIIGKILGKDITKEGSNNIGATNTFRLLGPVPGITAFFLDFSKGILAITITRLITNDPYITILSGIMVIIGHIFSLFVKFKGGKGVAVGLGVLCSLSPLVFVLCLIWAIVVISITRYVSLASITGSIIAAILMFLFKEPLPFSIFISLATLLIIIKHKSNIERLINKSERKINFNANKS